MLLRMIAFSWGQENKVGSCHNFDVGVFSMRLCDGINGLLSEIIVRTFVTFMYIICAVIF